MTRFMSTKHIAGSPRGFLSIVSLVMLLAPAAAQAAIDGVAGSNFSLTARAGYISISDGGSVYSWGYSESGAATMQLPGPTLIVTEGDEINVTLTNSLPAAAGNVSIVFPGHSLTSTTGGVAGLLTQEAAPGGSVTYTFTASTPGTYQYHSGTRPDLQVEMGLYGALIVRPLAAPPAGCTDWAYAHDQTCFDREYLFLLSEVDIDLHQAVELQAGGVGPIAAVTEPYRPEYWLMNGRAAPDTMAAAGAGTLPTQPYNAMPRMHPGERVLLRIVGANRQEHPFHHHGNHSRVIARDGHLLDSAGPPPTVLTGPRLFTIHSVPGETVDAIFEWTGENLGWDIYGTAADGFPHNCVDSENNETHVAVSDGYADSGSDYPWEWCADHDKPIPVLLPSLNVLAFGGFWGGSPYLGVLGSLPPGEGGLNPNAGYTYMWHSHTERELVNNDIFPGGMMTMLIIEAPGVAIP